MRKALVGLVVLAVFVPSANAARTPADVPYLSVSEAKAAAGVWSRGWVSGFTESPAKVTARCKKVARDRARCQVRIVGDRLDASLKLLIRETPDQYLVSASDLRVK